jgi:hypothetical protein
MVPAQKGIKCRAQIKISINAAAAVSKGEQDPGEFKNRRKRRSRRGEEAELFFAPKSASSRRRLPFLNTHWIRLENATCRIAFSVRLADSIGGFAGAMQFRTGARPSRSLRSGSRRLAWLLGRRHPMVRSGSREGFRRDAENCGRDARAPENELNRFLQ